MTLHTLSFYTHAGLGVLALATFWIAGLSRKGSPLHRAAGKVYLPAMTGLLLAAVPLAIAVFQRMPVAGSFLGYLLVLTVTSVWCSWRAVKDKKDWARYTGPVFRGLMWANLASALVIAGVGLLLAKQMQLVIVSFSGIGLFAFVQMWRFSRQRPEDPRWWLREHLNAMLGNGVATHIAFLSIGLPKVLPMLAGATLMNLAWLGPLVVAFVAGVYLTRKFLPKRAAPPAGVGVAG
ncbi:hypothetical protein [Arenimonas metalli]|uniref:DUF2306 domain-containing protein n=1 Tax=Arenimonas metalli CF5-1 TaxID=1384056 RepID=A0A091AU57_9GAMM|nr:hypothetical protein [Arenimonas metalli]KFN42742.1 hypothetical protein N787_03560 [Arenimonas metalli CF5-1]